MLKKLNCDLSGHEYTVRGDAGRVFLRCTTCGHTSSGWHLADTPPTRSAPRLSRLERLLIGKREPVKANLR
jgi:hypothetical protein